MFGLRREHRILGLAPARSERLAVAPERRLAHRHLGRFGFETPEGIVEQQLQVRVPERRRLRTGLLQCGDPLGTDGLYQPADVAIGVVVSLLSVAIHRIARRRAGALCAWLDRVLTS